ncbi:MAG: 3-methyl-2-oxobutanoate hydroxymethyltransferase [Armatimonadetes bacterium]|nr:3-methyl-2-oxobutanoate hydroxymethyltransferase [Armatimonadota bacterium]
MHIFARKKRDKSPLSMLSLYDAPSAQIACEAGADAILVGDSLGNAILGYDSTLPVTMSDMLRHTGAVVRGVKSSSRVDVAVVADLPFGSYATPKRAIKNAVALLQIGAHAVKIEGVNPDLLQKMAREGIPVMGHLGFTPQSVLQFESVVQGKTSEVGQRLARQAAVLEECGAFAVVLEAVTGEVAQHITAQLKIATVGIGAGAGCDGQVLVWNDVVGLSPQTFKLAKAWANTRQIWLEAAQNYVGEVQNGSFPAPENGWNMNDEERAKFSASHDEIEIETLDEQPF